jgi:hypothetical protein
MLEGKYIAIAAMWIGVGIVGLRFGEAAAGVAFFAFLGTLALS